uniref:Uncharacterized protein n=1 Tax=Ixodes ricinus TaxID=34613 RepID=A0A6B0UUG6_IXORI
MLAAYRRKSCGIIASTLNAPTTLSHAHPVATLAAALRTIPFFGSLRPCTTAVLYRTVSSTFWEKKPTFLSRRQLCEIARIGDDKTVKNDSARKNGCLSIMFPFFFFFFLALSHVFGDVVLCVEPWYCERALFSLSLPLPSRG